MSSSLAKPTRGVDSTVPQTLRRVSARRRWLLGAVLLTISACERTPGTLDVRNAWSWPTAPGRYQETSPPSASPDADQELGPGVVYLEIVNGTRQDDRLLSAEAAVCRVTELHETRESEGRMTMVPLPHGVEVPARSVLSFEPGGRHVMLIDLHQDLLLGQRFDLSLEFENAGVILVQSEVRRGATSEASEDSSDRP